MEALIPPPPKLMVQKSSCKLGLQDYVPDKIFSDSMKEL